MTRRILGSLQSSSYLSWIALTCSLSLFATHFLFGGGSTKLINDSRVYLFMADGGQGVGTPYSTRLFAPLIVSLIKITFGVSSLTAFHILTIVSIAVALILIRKVVENDSGSTEWQAAIVLSFGCALGVTFGYTPVMVDPVLLLIACCATIALERQNWTFVFVCSLIAAFTKEYGVLIGFASGAVVWRRGFRKTAVVAAFLPLMLLLVAMLAAPHSANGGFLSWRDFVAAMFSYHIDLYNFRGSSDYFKLMYMWSWSVLWPVLIISGGLIYSRFRRGDRMSDHEIAFSFMLLMIPVLLVGDWGRALLVIVPTGCAVATKHPLSKQPQFIALVAMGGLFTSLARPFHGEYPFKPELVLVMAAISVVTSLLIATSMLRFAFSKSTLEPAERFEAPASEAAVR